MELDFSDIKPSVLNALTIALTVIIMIPLLKFVLNKWQVPGLTDLVNAV
jgi:hypothetical protein